MIEVVIGWLVFYTFSCARSREKKYTCGEGEIRTQNPLPSLTFSFSEQQQPADDSENDGSKEDVDVVMWMDIPPSHNAPWVG